MKALISLAIVASFVFLLAGCISGAPLKVAPTHKSTHSTPEALNSTATGLDALILLSVVTIGVAVAVFFVAPVGHGTSFSLGAGAGAVLVVSLIVRVSLWLIPWIAGGLGILSLIVLAYELWINRSKALPSLATIESDASKLESTVSTDVSAAVKKVETAV